MNSLWKMLSLLVTTGMTVAQVIRDIREASRVKTLVVYYSLTGNTETAALELARTMDADVLRVEDLKKPSLFSAYVFGGFAALSGREGAIRPVKTDLSGYERIFIGSPVWAGSPAPALNTFIAYADFSGKEVVPFVTMGGRSPGGSLRKMSERIERRGGRTAEPFSLRSRDRNELIARSRETALRYGR